MARMPLPVRDMLIDPQGPRPLARKLVPIGAVLARLPAVPRALPGNRNDLDGSGAQPMRRWANRGDEEAGTASPALQGDDKGHSERSVPRDPPREPSRSVDPPPAEPADELDKPEPGHPQVEDSDAGHATPAPAARASALHMQAQDTRVLH